jgi:phosphoenolpyruvate-protein kinase (PTS system EI component)
MSAVSVPAVKKTIRAITREEAVALAAEAMSLGTHREIEALLRDRLRKVIVPGV